LRSQHAGYGVGKARTHLVKERFAGQAPNRGTRSRLEPRVQASDRFQRFSQGRVPGDGLQDCHLAAVCFLDPSKLAIASLEGEKPRGKAQAHRHRQDY
jgi:hypothetical protein